MITKKELAVRKGVGNHVVIINEDDEKLLRSTLEDHAWALTFRQIEEESTVCDIPKSTVCDFMKKNHWRQVHGPALSQRMSKAA